MGRLQKPERRRRHKRVGQKLDSTPPKIDRFVPRRDHNPRELISWAKRTGFISNLSGETVASASERDQNEKNDSAGFDLEKGLDSRGGSSSPKIEIDPILGRTRVNRGIEIEPSTGSGHGLTKKGSDGVMGLRDGTVRGENQRRRLGDEPVLGSKDAERKVNLNGNEKTNGNVNVNGNGQEVVGVTPAAESKKDDSIDEREVGINVYPDGEEPVRGGTGGWHRSSAMKCGLRENPGFVPLMYYGLQHYLSLAGSLIFIPLIIVPAMGGTDKDTATVISTMLLVSGMTTILHSYFGTRLPLVQGSSFVTWHQH
ncbi:hypothetical protein L1049_024192 [Liquidambar formosana]|uniref:Nucleobase-ascorbate transporter 11 n=1 Tax=Liquidambar formosana TaxID=63359 RepID=A0AAP0X4L7_LIQFO